MDRLTHIGEHGPYWDESAFDKFGGMEEDIIIQRLAAYEQTGLTPHEITDAVGWMTPVCIGCDGKTREGDRTDKCGYLTGDVHKCMGQSKHIADLMRAEQEGRLAILPCKVGDDIWWIDDEEPFVKCDEVGVAGIAITKDGVRLLDHHGGLDTIGTRYCYLTKEDAEKALEEGNYE